MTIVGIRPFWALLNWVVCLAWSWSLQGQPTPSETHEWRLHSTDCHLIPGTWKVREEGSISDVASENLAERCHSIEFSCHAGTEVLLACDIPPAYVIPELEISLEICAAQQPVQLLLEVTLPKTRSGSGDGPLKTVLRGPSLNDANRWQTLTMGGDSLSLPDLLKERLWILRRKHGGTIDEQGAYVSGVLVNAYSTAGRHRVWLKQPKLNGAASRVDTYRSPVMRDLQIAPASFDEEDRRPPARSQRSGTTLEVDRVPFFARVIQHNGESFEFLKRLGFNTLQLPATATAEQLQQARQLDLWLICPPPPSTGMKPIGDYYDPVLAWSLGDNLTTSNAAAANNLARDIRAADSKLNRPLFSGVAAGFGVASQSSDFLAVGLPLLGTNFPLIRYSNWLQTVGAATGKQVPLCADIQTEGLSQVVQQAGFLTGRLSPTPLEREQIKSLVYEALCGGARALRFLSRTRLDSNDPQTRLRALTLQWINGHVSLLEPWVVGGVVMGEATFEPNLVVTTLKTNRGQLLLIQQTTGLEQYVAGDPPLQTIRIQDTYSAVADQAYLLNDSGLTPIVHASGTNGGLIQIDQCPATAAVVLTQNPAVLNRITQSFERFGVAGLVNRRADLTRQWLAFTQIAETELSQKGHSSPLASGAFNEALNALQQAEGLILNNSYSTALPFLDLADQKLAATRRELQGLAREQFASETSAPLLTHLSLLARHWELAEALSPMGEAANGLPGGDFENLEHMLTNGWEQTVTNDPEIQTQVELASVAAGAGDSGLLLVAKGNAKEGAALDSPPITIRSAPIAIRNSQVFLIHGWVKIDQPLQNTEEGVVIYDTLGGRAMATRFRQTQGWQEFKIYRAAGAANNVRVLFELNGLGTAMFDEITVRTMDLPQPPSRNAANSIPADSAGETNKK